MTGVKIRGPFLGPSGYDNHVREFTRVLAKRGIGVTLENLNWGPVQLPYELRDPWFEALKPAENPGSVLYFSFPTQVQRDPLLPTLNFTMFEATTIPRDWVPAHALSDLIIVPTEHSWRAWIDSGVPESKLRLCPLGVRSDRFRPGVRPLDLGIATGRPVSSYGVRFINVSELSMRKNHVGLIEAWLRATTSNDDAVLILKIGAYNPGSLAEFQWQLKEAERRSGRAMADAAPLHVVTDLFPDADMPRVYAAGTHYISTSFGEGWDLSMIQAAATGLRLIAPRHSAYTAYLDDDIATFISATEQPAIPKGAKWFHEFFRDARWWVPDLDEATAAIRAAVLGTESPKASPQERIAEQFNWDRAADRLIEILDEAEAMTSRR